MQRIRSFLSSLPQRNRNLILAIGSITLAFLLFSLLTLKDLLAPANLSEFIVNPVPMVIFIVGAISTFLALRGKIRLASYLMIGGIIVGFMLIAIFSAIPTYSTIAELLIVVLPIMIAIQALGETEFTWIVIVTLLLRSIITILGITKSSGSVSGISSVTETIAQWLSAFIAILFGVYVAFNLNNYPFRVKLILVLGILTIVPTTILANISRNNLQSNLVGQANQNLVFSADQLSNMLDSFLVTNLDTVRTEAQVQALEDFIAQREKSFSYGGILLARGTNLEKGATQALWAFMKKDPINIISIRLIDRTGTIQLSTNQADLANIIRNESLFTQPFTDGLPHISPITVAEDGIGIFHFTAPVRSSAGEINGVLDVTYSAAVLQQLIVRNSSRIGSGTSAMLLDQDNIILAHSTNPELVYRIANPKDENQVLELIQQARLQDLKYEQLAMLMPGLDSGLANLSQVQYFSGSFTPRGFGQNVNNSSEDQAGASILKTFNWHVVTFTSQSSLLLPVQQQTRRVVLLSILIGLVGIAIALGLTQVLVSPILSLTHTSERIAGGDITATAPVRTRDEIGSLSASFNAMTAQVRSLVGSLEERVAERTKALERRAVQLQAAGDVGSTVARLRNLSELLRQVARLISQRFGFYHVGIFLLDERGEYAVLSASNSEGGQRMLSRQHRLKVGEVGIVGNVAASGQARIALNVGQDAAYFSNPDLPLTQSEMALPLIAGGKILGVLDIQSTESAAFTEEDINTLKVLADQTAVAIENARLFSESQVALESARRAYGEASLRGWQNIIRGRRSSFGYISLSEEQVAPVSGEAAPEFHQVLQSGLPALSNADTTLHIPITVRGRAIGTIRMEKKKGNETWSPEDIDMAANLAGQLGNALESARLYTDIGQRAEREAVISDIASKIGASIHIDTILRTSIEELGRSLPDSEVIIQVGGQPLKGGKNG